MWCLSACLPVCLSVCLPLCLSVCLHVGLCVCMCVCMCACVSVCMHVCMCVCTVCRVAWHGMAWHWMAWNALWWYCFIWHGMVWQGSVVLWQFESHRLEPTKTFIFQKIIILAITKIISKSSAAWTAVFVYSENSCGSSLKFSPKDHGRPDPRTWRRGSRAAAALFRSWKKGQIASN